MSVEMAIGTLIGALLMMKTGRLMAIFTIPIRFIIKYKRVEITSIISMFIMVKTLFFMLIKARRLMELIIIE